MKAAQKNPHILYFITIIIVGLVFAGVLYRIKSGELELKNQELAIKQAQVEQEKEKIRLEAQTTEDKEAKLQVCIDEAQGKFKDLMTLNSTLSPQKDYPEARRWNSSEIREAVTIDLQNNKELCIKKYK